jgi:hypothetical protein
MRRINKNKYAIARQKILLKKKKNKLYKIKKLKSINFFIHNYCLNKKKEIQEIRSGVFRSKKFARFMKKKFKQRFKILNLNKLKNRSLIPSALKNTGYYLKKKQIKFNRLLRVKARRN